MNKAFIVNIAFLTISTSNCLFGMMGRHKLPSQQYRLPASRINPEVRTRIFKNLGTPSKPRSLENGTTSEPVLPINKSENKISNVKNSGQSVKKQYWTSREIPNDIYSFSSEWTFWDAVSYCAADLDDPECLRKVFEKSPNFEDYYDVPLWPRAQLTTQQTYSQYGCEFATKIGSYWQYIETIKNAGPKSRRFIVREDPCKLNDIISGESDEKHAMLQKLFKLNGAIRNDLPHFYSGLTHREIVNTVCTIL